MNYGYISFLFLLAVLGHLIGDFLLQPKEMALHKADKNAIGRSYCNLHVAIYTGVILFMLLPFKLHGWKVLAFYLSIAIPHWLIDHYSLANSWLRVIKGRTFLDAFYSKDTYRDFDVAFTSIVYTIVDSTMHIICLWLAIWWFYA